MTASRQKEPVARRGFLGRAAAAVAFAFTPSALRAESNGVDQGQASPEAWLQDLNAAHRLFFDIPDFVGAVPQLHMTNLLNTYRTAHGVEEKDINAVGGLWSRTTLLAANDAMWAKYRIGEYLNLRDAANEPFTRNPWRVAPFILGAERPASGIEALQARGVRYIVCNNAMNFHVGQLATARSLETPAVNADIRANLLPGVVVVSAMVIAIERAQKHGFAYIRE
jgi:intracellular sulfur oxidation DsrE/DsrF family protein